MFFAYKNTDPFKTLKEQKENRSLKVCEKPIFTSPLSHFIKNKRFSQTILGMQLCVCGTVYNICFEKISNKMQTFNLKENLIRG